MGVGYSFDIFGRKNLIAASYMTLIGLIWLLPFTQSIAWLILNRIVASVAYQFLHSHPLIVDYIKSESRGKAASLQAMGSGIGEFIAMTVLLTIQLNFSTHAGSWMVGLVILGMTSIVLYMVREPTLI